MTNFAKLKLRVGFDDGKQSLFASTIYGIEIDNAVPLLVLEVAQDSVHAYKVSSAPFGTYRSFTRCCIRYKYAFIGRDVEQSSDPFPRLVEKINILVPQELIRGCFRQLLIPTESIANW